jgi:23S rRNA (adenine2503-C2)-methyltransferase
VRLLAEQKQRWCDTRGGLARARGVVSTRSSIAMTAPLTPSLYDFSYPELEARLVGEGVRPIHARALWQALYRELDSAPRARKDFLPPLQRWLSEGEGKSLPVARVVDEVESGDGWTRKLLFSLVDEQQVEAVLMGFPGRFTACLSTQAGCAMGCVFCATGQMGFVRHLRPGEIVAQAVEAQRRLVAGGDSLRNLVMMGMGEPFHNYDALMEALRIISDSRGLNLAPSRITVSTVGVVPGIVRFADEKPRFNLAVSLHATTDEERSALVPVNQRWPLSELLEACRYYVNRSGQRLFFGWTLIEGRNDSPEHARRIVELIRGMDAHVNLIRLNPTPGFDGVTPGQAAAEAFRGIIQEAGFPCTIRQHRGIDVAAGCGQLKAARVREGQRAAEIA